MRRLQTSFLVISLSLTGSLAYAEDLTLINVAGDKAPALAAAAKDTGLGIRAGEATSVAFSGPLVVWQARGGGGTEITPQTAGALAEYVRGGGSLLLTLSQTPGTGPFRLSSILPTTAWNTQGPQSLDAMRRTGAITVRESDEALFPKSTVQGLNLPFYFPIRPFHTVERGEGRYERFQRVIPYIDMPVTPDNAFWTRPLLNRDWEIRLRGDDAGETPLLLTGRYGAGRVAVFASSLEEMADSPLTRALWTRTLQWLVPKGPNTAPGTSPANFPAPVVAVDKAAGVLNVTLKNPTAAALPVQIVARVSTWERALVGDVDGSATLPANGQVTVTLPLPKNGPTDYQALDFRDAFNVRLGVLSADGRNLLNESRHAVDMSPAVGVTVSTNNTRNMPYPFKAPAADILNFPFRMGMEMDQYSYPPGTPVNAEVVLTNGTRNIAPLATVRDETKPDNASVIALNDEAGQIEQAPGPDKVQAYGAWTGQGGQENVVSFGYEVPVTFAGITLVGNPDTFRGHTGRNPGAAVIEIDGKEAGRAEGLDQKFVDGAGQVHITFAPLQGRVLRVRFPWLPTLDGTRNKRGAPCLADIHIDGSTEALPKPAQGTLAVTLRDSLTGETTPIASQAVTVQPGEIKRLQFKATPPAKGAEAHFYRIEANFGGGQGEAPVLVIQPTHPLQPIQGLKPSDTTPDLGFIVTRGFRNVTRTGTGTDEIPPATWATPDDLIWAYAHQMKQLGAAARTQANRLYLTDNDMRHYSTPWRDLPDGTYFYDIAPAMLVDIMKRDARWKNSDRASLSHSDRWDGAPDVDALHGWQDFIGFDAYLRVQKLPGLQGKTRSELTNEIHTKYESRWQAWNLQRYVHAIHNLRETFAREGKDLVITSQGSPIVPAAFEKDVAATLRGQSDDVTWGMIEENAPLSVGRQMGILAFNPGSAMSTLIQWGWDSAVLNNQHWHNPVGTTESSRRLLYDRAWRGTLGWDGQYKSIHTYGYNQNGGYSYTMTDNDYQEFWKVKERHSLIAPEAPLGAGLVISTARFSDPDHTSWSGAGGWGKSKADDQVRSVSRAVRAFQEAGISVPFAANVGTLASWPGDAPLILLDVCNFSADEVTILQKLRARGVRLVAFKGTDPLSAPAAALFGVTPDGAPTTGQKAGELDGKAMVANGTSLLIAGSIDDLSVPEARTIAPLLKRTLGLPITFPVGTAGYGFVSQGQKFIVLEDWREEGRTVSLRVRAGAAARAARAVNVNEHSALSVRRDGNDWIVEVPMRPGDGVLVCLNEN